MLDIEMRRGLTEAIAILKCASKEELEQIPQSFMDFLINNMDKDYTFEIPKDTPLTEIELRDETKNILSLIACLYLLSDMQRVYEIVNSNGAKQLEWMLAFGIAYTMLWIYIELLRIVFLILSIVRRN